MTLARDRSALMVVAMHNGFLDDAGSMARLGLPVADLRSKALPGTLTLVAAPRHADIPSSTTATSTCPGTATAV